MSATHEVTPGETPTAATHNGALLAASFDRIERRLKDPVARLARLIELDSSQRGIDSST